MARTRADGTIATMMSLAALIRHRLIHAAALVAVLVFGWQGAAQSPAVAALHVPASGTSHGYVAAEDIRPAQTILPAAPIEIAKPAPQQPRPSGALAPATIADDPSAVSSLPLGRTEHEAALRPAGEFSPPYAARGPPLLS